MKLDSAVILIAVTAATFQTGYLLADSSRTEDLGAVPVADAAITAQIRTAFHREPTLDAADIAVKTSHGKVRLRGRVNSDDEAARAEDIASRIEGVHEVRSQLQVQPGGAEEIAAAR